MERNKCSTASVALVGALMLLGCGAWWLVAMDRERKEHARRLIMWDERENSLESARPLSSINRSEQQAIIKWLRADLGQEPRIVAWAREPLGNLCRQGGKVIRVQYHEKDAESIVEDYFLVGNGQTIRLTSGPSSSAEGIPVGANVNWKQQLKKLDRMLGLFGDMQRAP